MSMPALEKPGTLAAALKQLHQKGEKLHAGLSAAQAGALDLSAVYAEYSSMRAEFMEFQAVKVRRYSELISALQDRERDMSAMLRKLRKKFQDDLVGLLGIALKNRDGRSSAHTAILLGKNGPAALPCLMDVFEHGPPDLFLAAAAGLQELGPHGVQPLRAVLKNPGCSHVRCKTLEILGKFGEGSAAAVPEIVDALGDSNLLVRREAASTLVNIGRTAVVPALRTAIKHPDPVIRHGAVWVLGMVGAKEATADLTAAFKDPDARVRSNAATVLGENAFHSAEIEAELEEISRSDSNLQVRVAAQNALEKFWLNKNMTNPASN